MALDPTKTYKVHYNLRYLGKNWGLFITDLAHYRGLWWLVFEWTADSAAGLNERPLVAVEVDDLSILLPLGRDFCVSLPIEIPERDDLTALLSQSKGKLN